MTPFKKGQQALWARHRELVTIVAGPEQVQRLGKPGTVLVYRVAPWNPIRKQMHYYFLAPAHELVGDSQISVQPPANDPEFRRFINTAIGKRGKR